MKYLHKSTFRPATTLLAVAWVLVATMETASAGDAPVVSEPSMLPLLVMSAATLLVTKLVRNRKK